AVFAAISHSAGARVMLATGLGFLWLLVASVVVVVALHRRRAFRLRDTAIDPSLSVVLVRPCRGLARDLERSLMSIARARYSFRLQVRIGLASGADPAALVAERAAAALRRLDIPAEVVEIPAVGSNHKASTLAGVSAGASADVIISADSNVDLAGLDLDAL